MKFWGLETLFLAVTPFLVFVSTCSAEFLCRQSVSYQWVKGKEDKGTEVHWITIEAKGKDEADAKSALDEPLTRERKKAKEACQKEHENLAGCIATKYTALGPTLERMGFSQRKGVEDAIQSDCQIHQGTCREVSLGELQCSELAAAPAAGTAEAAPKDAKDAKSKKK